MFNLCFIYYEQMPVENRHCTANFCLLCLEIVRDVSERSVGSPRGDSSVVVGAYFVLMVVGGFCGEIL